MPYYIEFTKNNKNHLYTFHLSNGGEFVRMKQELMPDADFSDIDDFIFRPAQFFNPLFKKCIEQNLYFIPIFAKLEKQDNTFEKFGDRYIIPDNEVHFFMTQLEEAFKRDFFVATCKSDIELFSCLNEYKNSLQNDSKTFKKNKEITNLIIYNDQTKLNSISNAIELGTHSLKDILLNEDFLEYVRKTPKGSDLFDDMSSLFHGFKDNIDDLSPFLYMTPRNAKNNFISKRRMKKFHFKVD